MDPVLAEHLKRQAFLLQRILAAMDRLVELAEQESQPDDDIDDSPGTDLSGRVIR